MKKDTLNALLEARAQRRAVVLVTALDSGSESVIYEDAQDETHPLAGQIADSVRTGRSTIVESNGGEQFLQAFLPAPRLIIVGATHIAQVLVRLSREVEIEPIVIDPRTAFATEERFRDVDIVTEWPGEALGTLGLDRRSAVVCLAHVPDIDDEALGAALNSECFYIGALGSSRSHAKRLERLKEQGRDESQFERIHGPVGLDIGSVTPAEIALSIISEVVLTLRKEPS